MRYKTIDMDNFPRKDHFNYFKSTSYPYVGITVDVDVTDLVEFCRKNKYSFYSLFVHIVALSADKIPELRQRIYNDGIIEYEECMTSHVELKKDGTFCFCQLKHHMELEKYMKYATQKRQESAEKGSIEYIGDMNSLYFVSTIPWLHYNTIMPPLEFNQESIPRFIWGKFEKNCQGKLMMPVTLYAHHALVDGIHLAKFYEELNTQIKLILNL